MFTCRGHIADYFFRL